MTDEIIPPATIIERDGSTIRFKGLYDSFKSGQPVETPAHSPAFEQSNAAGNLRQLDTVEEACIEGQRLAILMRRIAKID